MANTIDWGQGAVNNTIDWGKGKTNATNNWGAIYDSTAAGETNITGSGGGTPFTNTYSMNFDGSLTYVTLGNPINLRLTADFSISCWMKFTDSGATKYALSMGDQYGIYTSSGTIRGFARIGGAFTSLTSVGTFNDGAWHHVLYVKNSTNMLLYIDGSLNASNTSGGTNTASALDQRIGARYTSANVYAGNLDELAIWDSDQSANVSNIYASGSVIDLSTYSPLGWWRMGDSDGGTGTTLTDLGSGTNNGTLVNSPTFQTDVP